jgi:hypothetical protein
MRHITIALTLAVGLAGVLAAQEITGSLYGTVTDPSGAAIANAQITATSAERGNVRHSASNEKGEWVLTQMPIGTYSVKVEAQGFKAFDRQGIALNSEDNIKLDSRLALGNASESITVTSEAPQVDSRSSTLGATIGEKTLLDMPLDGRNIFDLTTLLPGVTSVSDPQTFTNDRQGPTFSTSGSRSAQNNMTFDGSLFVALFRNTGLNYPPPDALAEVRIQTSNYTAEYGRNSGTSMNVVTKSGTNTLHGSAWEFTRNSAFNARSFFSKTVNKLVQNQYGGTLGGPVIRNKLFLFGSYQGLKVRTAALTSSAKPLTSAEASGTFSSKITDPLNNNQPFPQSGKNYVIPASRFDPVALKINSLIQPANSSNGQLIATYSAPQDDDQALIRGDYYWGKHAIDARYNQVQSNDEKSSGNVPGYERIADATQYHTASIGDTLPISPNLLNVLRLAYNRFGGTVSVLTPYSLASLGSSLPVYGPPTPSEINVSSRFDIGNTSASPALLVNENREFSDSLTWIHGAHTFKGGFQFLRLQYLNRTWFQAQGGFTFSGIFTGQSAADFLLGTAQSLSISTPQLEQGGIQHNSFSYFQDDWRINRRLTINLGLRYELAFPWYQPNDYWGSFVAGQQSQIYKNAPAGLVFPGDPGIPRGLVQTDANNFAPRVGFAYDLRGDGKTAIRGGFGVFYDAITANIIQNGTQPFRYSYGINAPYSLTDPLRGLPSLPSGVNLANPAFSTVPPPGLTFPSPTMRTPYTFQYNLTVQRQVLRDTVVEVAYVGKLGRKLLTDIGTNPAVFAPGATVANEDARRVYKGFGSLNTMGTFANSEYNALQFRANKRYARHLMVQGTYTFSKAMDNSSSNVSDTASIPNPFNLKGEWGLADFYARHIASIAGTYELPKLANHNIFLREGAGGWNLSGRFTARSGQPINVVTGADNALTGTPQQRPNVNGDPLLSGSRTKAEQIAQWFNPAVFSLPAAGAFGNLGRNALIGPGQQSTNVAVLKNFPIAGRERMYLQFRTEAFSATNTPIFKNPTNTYGSSLGKITSASGDRHLQFALKLVF